MTPRMAAILAALRKQNESRAKEKEPEVRVEIRTPEQAMAEVIEKAQELANNQNFDKYGNIITYNEKQQQAINLAEKGESFVLIGPAGTGKTTVMRGVFQKLIASGKIPPLHSSTKCLVQGSPGLAIMAYTRRAVNNIRNNVSDDVKRNCVTVHKLLEFQPKWYETQDPFGGSKNKMKFEPNRDRYNPLPVSLTVMGYEESSMLGLDLYNQVQDATPHEIQEIFLGDIQQLPPIFGPAILGYKLLELPVIELTEVYRQALESPILRLAHRILSGRVIEATEFTQWNYPGQLTIRPWKKSISPTAATGTLANVFIALEENKQYDPEEDVILTPYNKECGSIELNRHIATHLAWKRDALIHEIVAGYNKHYLSVGDRVMFEKNDATILEIEANPDYSGKYYRQPSINYNYWGHKVGKKMEEDHSSPDDETDFLLSQVALPTEDKEERTQQCSHRIKLRMTDSEIDMWIDKAAQVNALLMGYVLTIHKAQGSEWRKVFLALHQSHNKMLQRELLYTAVTRAKEELYVMCEPDTFVRGIESQKIKGDTLEEKAEWFKGRYVKENGNGDE